DAVRLDSRRGEDWTARFDALARAVAELPVEEAIFDGEDRVARCARSSRLSGVAERFFGRSDERGRLLPIRSPPPGRLRPDGSDARRSQSCARSPSEERPRERTAHPAERSREGTRSGVLPGGL